MPGKPFTLLDSEGSQTGAPPTGPESWDWSEHVSQSFKNGNEQVQAASVHDFVEAGTVLIGAAPARIMDQETDEWAVVPIGLIESAVVTQNKPLNRIFEIGSKMSYIIPGRAVGSIQLSRVFFDSDSLMKALYWGEISAFDKETNQAKFRSTGDIQIPSVETPHKPWSKRVSQNIMHEFFDHPFGLVFYYADNQKDTLGISYFEGCHVTGYTMGITAAANVLTEGVTIEFIRAVPMEVPGENDQDIFTVAAPVTGATT